MRALVASARAGDRAAVIARIGPRTRARLMDDARVASEQAGRRRIAPGDLLVIGWAPPSEEEPTLRTVEENGDRAVVELRSRASSERLEVVREADGWKVELP